MYDDEWPSHQQELSRKAATQLKKWTDYYEIGKITKREYILIIHTLYHTVSGLIDRELDQLISDIDWEVRTGEPKS